MTVTVFLAILAPAAALLLGAVPAGRFLADHLRPAAAAGVLTATGAVLALTSCFASALLVTLGLTRWNPASARADWALARDVSVDHVGVLAVVLAVVGALLLAVSTVRLTRTLISAAAQYGAARALTAGLPPGSVLRRHDAGTTARALPVRGGHVLVDTGAWSTMESSRRRIVLAHERSHLRHRHDLYLLAGAVYTAANPLLAPVADALGYALERWADEDAAREVEDRALVARTLGWVALRDADRPTPVLAAGGGVVPRRVAALLGPAGTAVPTVRGAVVTAGLAAGLVVTVGVGQHAWVDLLEILAAR